MSKRMTKVAREAAAKAALRRRIVDIATGARGGEVDSEMEDSFCPEDLCRLVPAIEILWPEAVKVAPWLTRVDQLDHYEDVSSLVDWLFSQGLRA